MTKKFRFEMENGHLYEGSLEIVVRNGVAEIEESDINPDVLLLIKVNGGQEVIGKKPKPKRSGKKESTESLVRSTLDVLEKAKNMAEGN